MQTLARGMMSGLDEARQVVLRSEAEWQALWRAHAPGQPMPRVDVPRQMVVGVFAGSRPTAGFDVEILRVERDGRTLLVHYAERTPPAGAPAAQVLTSPFHLVAVPAHGGAVEFRRAPDAP